MGSPPSPAGGPGISVFLGGGGRGLTAWLDWGVGIGGLSFPLAGSLTHPSRHSPPFPLLPPVSASPTPPHLPSPVPPLKAALAFEGLETGENPPAPPQCPLRAGALATVGVGREGGGSGWSV